SLQRQSSCTASRGEPAGHESAVCIGVRDRYAVATWCAYRRNHVSAETFYAEDAGVEDTPGARNAAHQGCGGGLVGDSNEAPVAKNFCADNFRHGVPKQERTGKQQPCPACSPRQENRQNSPRHSERECETEVSPGAGIANGARPSQLMRQKGAERIFGQKSFD